MNRNCRNAAATRNFAATAGTPQPLPKKLTAPNIRISVPANTYFHFRKRETLPYNIAVSALIISYIC